MLQIPEFKSKRDGEIQEWSGEAEALAMRGNYSKDDIIKIALEKGLITKFYAERYNKYGRYYQSWFKNAPRSGYVYWAYPFDKPVRGSYFASVLTLD